MLPELLGLGGLVLILCLIAGIGLRWRKTNKPFKPPCIYCQEFEDVHQEGCPTQVGAHMRVLAKQMWDLGHHDGILGEEPLDSGNHTYMLGFDAGRRRYRTLLADGSDSPRLVNLAHNR